MLLWSGGKGPAEEMPFDLDWTLRLAGDTITASEWTIVGGDIGAEGTLEIVSDDNTTTMTAVVLSGGNLGQQYILQNEVTTAGGGTPLTEKVLLPMRDR